MPIPSKEAILSFLPQPVKISGKHIICTCYNCQKESHFFYNFQTGLNDCKKCSISGNINSFLRGWGKLHLLEGKSLNLVLNVLEPEQAQQQLDLDLPVQKLPIGFTPLYHADKNKFSDYLIKRKFTQIDFELYQPGYSELLCRYQDYVLLPVQRDLLIKGLVGRYIGNDDTKKRYENSKGTKFTKLLLGLDELTQATTTIIAVEGPFDKVSVTTELDLHTQDEIKCVCTFGKKISTYQLQLISKYKNVSNLIFAYDIYDAINEMKRGGLAALDYFKNVYACKYITQKDPGAMNRNSILKMLDSAEKIQNFVYNRVKLYPVN